MIIDERQSILQVREKLSRECPEKGESDSEKPDFQLLSSGSVHFHAVQADPAPHGLPLEVRKLPMTENNDF